MSLLRSFPIMVMVMVMLAIVGVCISQQTVPLLLFAATLAAVSWYVTEGPRGRTLPRLASNLLALAVVAGSLADLLVPPNDVLHVLGRFAVGLTLIKLYERRRARDHAHLMGLSLLLMIISCVRTRELLFGVVLGAYAVLGLYTLLLLQLYTDYERVVLERRRARADDEDRSARRDREGGFGPPLSATGARPTVGRRAKLHFRMLAAGIGVAGLLVSVGFFVIFPRSLAQGVLSTSGRGASPGRQTGYADEIDLYSGTRITESRRLVCDVRLRDAEGRPWRADAPLLLRGAVLDQYARGRWFASPRWIRVEATERTVPLAKRGSELADVIEQQVRFNRYTGTLFGLYAPVAVRTPTAPLEFDQRSLELRAPGGVRTYAVTSVPRPSEELLATISDAEAMPPPPAAMVGAGIDERIGYFARARLEDAGLAANRPEGPAWRWSLDVARVLSDHLVSGAYTYTLDVSGVIRDDPEPVAEFLLETRRGHCEHFASALALMCRSVGVEARVIAGFAASRYDEDEGAYVVLASDAHAWVEVRAGPRRFVAFDPTSAGERGLSAADSVLAQRLERLYQRLEGSWMTRVIEFDDHSQQALLGSVSAAWIDRARGAYDWMARVNSAFRLGPSGYIWLGIMGLVVVIACVAVATVLRRIMAVRRALRVRRVGFAESRRMVRSLGFYLDMLDVLRAGGHEKPAWQPPLAYALRLDPARPDAARLVQEITETYYRARYARQRLTREQLAQARRRVAELSALLGAGT